MPHNDIELAVCVAEHLLLGRQIAGFSCAPNISFSKMEDGNIREINNTLSIWNNWGLAHNEEEISNPEFETKPHNACSDLAHAAGELISFKVVEVKIHEETCDLSIKFENSHILFIRGYGEEFESWELNYEDFSVVACPGGELAVWAPDNFKKD
jgi:hypothetical protein